jgi:hypothetical protein
MPLPKELEELHKRINAECEKFEVESNEAARNLGLVLSHAALSGRRQGFFAGMKKEAERSQNLVDMLRLIQRKCLPGGTEYSVMIDKVISEYNQQP